MRQPNRPIQLEWTHADDMRWDELPADVRDRVREQLAALLRHVASHGTPRKERRDEA